MGTSFINFKDYGFWARDPTIEVWLYWLVQEIDQLEYLPEWLQEVREDQYIQATLGLVGSINPQLDDYLLSQDRVNLVLMLCEHVLKWLQEQGKYLSQEYLNSLGVGGPGSQWMAEVEVEMFVQFGRRFVELLSGEVRTDASTSPVFQQGRLYIDGGDPLREVSLDDQLANEKSLLPQQQVPYSMSLHRKE